MLVQLYRDNYSTTPLENLVSTIYNGFFDGVEGWFDTATVVNSELRTNDLTDINTITKNLFNSALSQSVKVTGFFRAKKTGSHRFFTGGNGEYILEIDGDDIIVKNTLVNEDSFANKSLIAGNYYSFNLYYGTPCFKYPPAFLSGVNDSTTLSGQEYGNGQYRVTFSSQTTTREARKLFASSGNWRPGNSDRVGGWVQLELPNPIVLHSFQVNTNTGGGTGVPQSFKLEGSNDNFTTSTLLNITNWGQNQGSKTIIIDPPVNQAFKYYKLTNLEVAYGSSYIQYNAPLIFYESASLSSGYLEPLDDGTNTGSINPDDFIKNASGLTTYYDINPTTQPVGTIANNPLIIEDDTLQGLFRISPLALYFNRGSFSTGKGTILYIASDDLFNNFNGTYKNYIQLHERPVSQDNTERKKFTQFSSDMSFECELNGKIEVYFRRGVNEPVTFRHAMLILDVERIPEKQL